MHCGVCLFGGYLKYEDFPSLIKTTEKCVLSDPAVLACASIEGTKNLSSHMSGKSFI